MAQITNCFNAVGLRGEHINMDARKLESYNIGTYRHPTVIQDLATSKDVHSKERKKEKAEGNEK